MLDLGLTLPARRFCDLVCLDGAHGTRCSSPTGPARPAGEPPPVREAVERSEDARQALGLSVKRGLAASALGFRIAGLG